MQEVVWDVVTGHPETGVPGRRADAGAGDGRGAGRALCARRYVDGFSGQFRNGRQRAAKGLRLEARCWPARRVQKWLIA